MSQSTIDLLNKINSSGNNRNFRKYYSLSAIYINEKLSSLKDALPLYRNYTLMMK